MLDLETLIKKLEKLKERNKKLINNEFIDQRIVQEKRKWLYIELKVEVNKLVKFGEKIAKLNQTTTNHILIHSKYTMTQDEKNPNIRPTAILDAPIIKLMKNGAKFNELDNSVSRICYLEEFIERSNILLESIPKGLLDDFFSLSIESIIHEINGRFGALLLDLKIRSLIGHTHKKLSKLEK